MVSKRIRKRLLHEVDVSLSQKDRRGESKHKAKAAARKAAQEAHNAFAPVTGLFASGSYATYQKQAMTALGWIAEKHGCKNLAECRPYLEEYYANMCSEGLSAWTIHTRVYALCAVYDDNYQTLFGVETLPERHRADIVRGRTISQTDARYQTQMQNDARTLSRACGARQGGLLALTANDLLVGENGELRIHLAEKGGKERDALVLPQYAEAVQELFARYGQGQGATTGGKKRLFPLQALPKDMPLHYLRAEYAKNLYTYYEQNNAATGKLYHCRGELQGQVYDKGVLMMVSKNLGHSRCDVVVSHYLYGAISAHEKQ